MRPPAATSPCAPTAAAAPAATSPTKPWHVIGLHRYELGEFDAIVPALRLSDDAPRFTRP